MKNCHVFLVFDIKYVSLCPFLVWNSQGILGLETEKGELVVLLFFSFSLEDEFTSCIVLLMKQLMSLRITHTRNS